MTRTELITKILKLKNKEDNVLELKMLYQLDKERLQTTVDEYYNTWMKAQEEIAEAMQTLQGKELEARIQQIKDHYQPLLEGYSKDITEANNNLIKLRSYSWDYLVNSIEE